VPISKRLVLINSASSVATRLLTVGVFAWAIQYLIKRIPAEELAILPIVMSVAVVVPLIQLVLSAGLSRHVTEAYARHDDAEVTRIVSSQFPLLLAAGLLIMALGTALTWNIHHLITVPAAMIGEMRLMMLLVIGGICGTMVLQPFNTGLFAKQEFVRRNAIDISGSILRILLMIVLILGFGPQVEWIVVAQVASQLYVQVASTLLSMSMVPALRYRPASFNWGTCKRVLSFGGWYFLLQSATAIRRAADAPILNEFASAIAVNNFFLGSVVETQLRELSYRAIGPLLPPLTAMHAHQQHKRLASAFLRGGRICLWAAMFFAVPLIVFSYDLFALYLGEKYTQHVDAAAVMILLLLGFPFTYPTLLFFSIANARGDVRPVALRALVAQLANLGLTLVLVGYYQFGAVGSAAATFVVLITAHPLMYWRQALRTLNIKWRRFVTESLLPGLLPTVGGACAGYLSLQLIGESSVARVLIGMPLCMLAYAVALFFALKPADRADLGRVRQYIGV
jgi:O-antigen/teichoic acid export membrane protein